MRAPEKCRSRRSSAWARRRRETAGGQPARTRMRSWCHEDRDAGGTPVGASPPCTEPRRRAAAGKLCVPPALDEDQRSRAAIGGRSDAGDLDVGHGRIDKLGARQSRDLGRRDSGATGTKKTGSVIRSLSDSAGNIALKAVSLAQKRVDMPKLKFCTSSVSFLDDRHRIVDAQRTERRSPDQAGTDRSAPFHARAADRAERIR